MGEVEIPVDGAGVVGAIAVIDVTPTGSFIRPGTDGGGIRVNGMLLTNPMPLLHGDKIDVAGQELRFSDDSTISSSRAFLPTPATRGPKATFS